MVLPGIGFCFDIFSLPFHVSNPVVSDKESVVLELALPSTLPAVSFPSVFKFVLLRFSILGNWILMRPGMNSFDLVLFENSHLISPVAFSLPNLRRFQRFFSQTHFSPTLSSISVCDSNHTKLKAFLLAHRSPLLCSASKICFLTFSLGKSHYLSSVSPNLFSFISTLVFRELSSFPLL